MNRFLTKFIRTHSLKSVIFIYILIFSLLTLFVLAKVSNFFMVNVVMDNYLTSYMESIYSSFEYMLNDMLNNINISYVNFTSWSDVYNVILDDNIDNSEKERLIAQYTNEFMSNTNIISAIDIITNDGLVYRNSENNIELPPIDSTFTSAVIPSKISIYNQPIQVDGEYYIAVGTKYRDFFTGFDMGYLILYIPESSFCSTYQEAILDNSSFFIIADDRIISHSDKTMLGATVFLPQESEENASALQHSKNIIGKHSVSNPNVNTDISIAAILSSDNLYNIVNKMKIYVYGISAIAFILTLVITLIFTQRLLKHYTMYKQDIKDFSQNPKKKFVFHSSNELKELTDSFNVMVKTINQLIEGISIAQENQREAEIKALQSHINPHFIYNALDSIVCMAKIEKQSRIEETAYALATFFRIGLSGGERLITLENELKHAKSYLQVQQTRFPNTFEVEFDIPDELLKCKILKITIQPLLENCINHAFKKSSKKKKITVNARVSENNNFIILTVADNGIGFTQNPLTIQKRDKTHGGYGIYNVQQRLKLEYGNDCGLSYEINEAGGTNAIVKIKYIID